MLWRFTQFNSRLDDIIIFPPEPNFYNGFLSSANGKDGDRNEEGGGGVF